jgi:23S rRNA pseudouridine1911/1915/1917 synthase
MMSDLSFSFLFDNISLESELRLMGLSKNQLKKFLSSKQLKSKVDAKKEWKLPMDLLNANKIAPEYEGESVNILHEDEDFLVLEKPIHVHTVSQRYSDEDSLSAWLRASGKNRWLEVNQNDFNRGALNRLDYKTSGIVFFTGKEAIYSDIRSCFSDVFVEKKYLCIVHGSTPESGVLRQKLAPYGEKGSRVQVSQNGVDCELMYKRLDQNDQYSLLEVKLITGFRHQIRVQLASIGHAVVGDDIYGIDDESELLLHAYHYQLQYNDKDFDIKTRYPKRFLKFFNFNGKL